mgnify:CR=1 FL=1
MIAAVEVEHWAAQNGPQSRLISCPCFEVFFGGARGGGKSDGILGEWIAHQDEFEDKARGLVVRREAVQLEDLITRSIELFSPMGWTWNGSSRTWTSKTGAILRFRPLWDEADASKYQGHQYTRLYPEELTNWPSPRPILMLYGTLRSAHGVHVGVRATGNPGGPGHNWVKARYIDPAPQGMKVIRDPVDGGLERVFIPSRLEDNPALTGRDMGYEARLKMVGGDLLYRAWRFGDWNIVAGGALDDLWPTNPRFVVPAFEIPKSWRLDRSFDWGSSKPNATIWFAESDGSECLVSGEKRIYPKGTLFAVAERYGWNGKPNEGTRELASEAARDIMAMQSQHPALTGRRIDPGPADPAIYSMEDGRSIASEMQKAGCHWLEAPAGPGSRAAGLEQVRSRLKASGTFPMESPGLLIFESCTHTLRTLPTLPRDLKKPDDVDTTAEDHLYDVVRYRLTAQDAQKVILGTRWRA